MDLHTLIASESANIDLNQLDRKVLRGFQVCSGTIYKVVSNYDYLLVKMKSNTVGHDLTRDGSEYFTDNKPASGAPGFSGGNSTTTVTEGDFESASIWDSDGGDYIVMTKGQEIVGNFSEVKILDGSANIYGADLEIKNHINISTDFTALAGSAQMGGFESGLVYWLDASDSSTMLALSGNVSRWDNKLDATHSFRQVTSLKQPEKVQIDLRTQGGSQFADAIQFTSGKYMSSNTGVGPANAFSEYTTPQADYYTIAMVVSGGTGLTGTILDRAYDDSGTTYCQNRFEIVNPSGSSAYYKRTIGGLIASGITEATVDIADQGTIIINSVGYDTQLATWADYVWIDSNGPSEAVSSYNYGNAWSATAGDTLGCEINWPTSTPTNFLEGNIHEILIFKNRLSVSEFADYGLNEEMVNAIGHYLDHKWFNGAIFENTY